MSAPMPDHLSMEVNGFGDVPIAVAIRPGTSDVPVVLVHGFGSSGRANWSATGWLGSLHRAGLTSVTVDLRGHGLSGKPHDADSYRLRYLVADLRRAIGALPQVIGPVRMIDLVGYSMGGRMVAELVATATGSGLGADLRGWDPDLPRLRRAEFGGYDGRPLPVFKNFYGGGIGSVRGFETSSIGPRDINGDPIGGAKRFNGNVELLFPLPGTGKDRAFRGFIFGDTGGVYGEKVKITAGQKTATVVSNVPVTDATTGITVNVPTPSTVIVGSGIKYSVGFGVNWLSPLGALRLSYGIPLHTLPTDKLQRIQFNIGNGF